MRSSSGLITILIMTLSSYLVNREDDFIFDHKSLGGIKRIRIRYDNAQASPGWFVNTVTIQDLDTYRKYKFPCGRWLDSSDQAEAAQEDLWVDGQKPDGTYALIDSSTNSEPRETTWLGENDNIFGPRR